MNQQFERLVEELLRIEGGYSDDARDSGGKTRYGITEALARAYGYQGAMSELPRDRAKGIYLDHFWRGQQLDKLCELAPGIAAELFDTGVNIGRAKAGEWLQRSLNVLNQLGAWWPDIKVDGSIGAITIAALTEYLRRRGGSAETVLLRALNGWQAVHYMTLAESREKDEAFVYGWMLNRCR